MGKERIFDYEGKLKGAVRRIKESDIHERNKELILNFKDIRYCKIYLIKQGYIVRYIYQKLKNKQKNCRDSNYL